MAEILHQLIGSLSHYFQGFIHPRCRISSINSIICFFQGIFGSMIFPAFPVWWNRWNLVLWRVVMMTIIVKTLYLWSSQTRHGEVVRPRSLVRSFVVGTWGFIRGLRWREQNTLKSGMRLGIQVWNAEQIIVKCTVWLDCVFWLCFRCCSHRIYVFDHVIL